MQLKQHSTIACSPDSKHLHRLTPLKEFFKTIDLYAHDVQYDIHNFSALYAHYIYIYTIYIYMHYE